MGRHLDNIVLYARHDPCSFFLGIHFLLTRDYIFTAMQSAFFVSAAVLYSEYSRLAAEHAAICCYPPNPSHAVVEIGGSCTNHNSPIYHYGDHAQCATMPLVQILVLSFGCAAVVASLLIYFKTYKYFKRRFDAIPASHKTAVFASLFPFTGIILGLHEKPVAPGLFRIRLLFFVMGILSYLVLDPLLIWNRATGCYPSFKYGFGPLADFDRGACDDYTSIIYAETGGGYNTWQSTWIFTGLFLLSSIIWFFVFVARLVGLKSASAVYVTTFADAYIEAAKRGVE